MFRRFIQIVYLVSIGFFFVSCIEFKESENEPTLAKKANLASFEIKEREGPNQYEINIRWTDENQHVIVTYNANQVFNSRSTEKLFIIEVEGGAGVHIVVEELVSGRKQPLGELSTIIPRDIVIEKNLNLNTNLNLSGNRVYLVHGTQIQTNGFDLSIKANKIFADDAYLASFPSGSQALPLTPGKSGGSISIQAKDAIGRLNIELRGQKGGDGVDGIPWEKSADNGVAGKDSQDAVFDGEIRSYSYCVRDAGDGWPGGNGAMGRDGSAGEKGGDSGTVLIHIENHSDLEVAHLIEAGEGGSSGAGSPGQRGGVGGQPGLAFSNCRPGQKGPDGRDGERGVTPPSKGQGEVNQSSIIIGRKCRLIGREVRSC